MSLLHIHITHIAIKAINITHISYTATHYITHIITLHTYYYYTH